MFSFMVLLSVTVYLVLLFGPQARVLDVDGTVTDALTAMPIAGARVQVSVWDYGIVNSSPHSQVVFTDGDGRFRLRRTMDFAIARVGVHAWSSNFSESGALGVSTYVSDILSGSMVSRSYVHFFPGQHHFQIQLKPQTAKEQAKWRDYLKRGWLD